jgi:hypothetical protein
MLQQTVCSRLSSGYISRRLTWWSYIEGTLGTGPHRQAQATEDRANRFDRQRSTPRQALTVCSGGSAQHEPNEITEVQRFFLLTRRHPEASTSKHAVPALPSACAAGQVLTADRVQAGRQQRPFVDMLVRVRERDSPTRTVTKPHPIEG